MMLVDSDMILGRASIMFPINGIQSRHTGKISPGDLHQAKISARGTSQVPLPLPRRRTVKVSSQAVYFQATRMDGPTAQ